MNFKVCEGRFNSRICSGKISNTTDVKDLKTFLNSCLPILINFLQRILERFGTVKLNLELFHDQKYKTDFFNPFIVDGLSFDDFHQPDFIAYLIVRSFPTFTHTRIKSLDQSMKSFLVLENFLQKEFFDDLLERHYEWESAFYLSKIHYLKIQIIEQNKHFYI